MTTPLRAIGLPPRPRFVLVGCFGERNAGDEALLQSAIHLIRLRWPDASITVFSEAPEQTARDFRVNAVPSVGFLSLRGAVWMLRRGRFKTIVRTLWSCDCIVVPGGEMLRTDFGLHAVLSVFDRILLGRIFRKPVVMMGAGAGRLDSGPALWIMRWASRGVPILTREAESAAALTSARIGVPVALSDLAFHLPEASHGVPLPGGPRVAIALRDPARTPSCAGMSISRADFLTGVARLADRAVSFGATPVFIAFSCSASDDDRLCHREVRSLMRNPAAACLVEEELPADRMKNLLSEMEVVVGMRLHACIFALSHARPVLALVYDPKVSKQMKHFGCEGAALPLEEIGAAPHRLEEIWNARGEWTQRIQPRLEEDRLRFAQALESLFGPPAGG
jgi:polysaccharide pyruvyl transferase WcaK-like protein